MSLSRSIANSYVKLCNEGNNKEVVAESVTSFLVENNLLSLKEKVLDHVEMIESEKERYNSLEIKSAFPMSAHTTKEILESICKDSSVKHFEKEDKSLIGGFVARYRGVEWDASISGVVDRLRKILKEQ